MLIFCGKRDQSEFLEKIPKLGGSNLIKKKKKTNNFSEFYKIISTFIYHEVFNICWLIT